MNPMMDRQLLSQVVVIVGACLGAWMLAVEPQIRDLSEVQTQIAEQASSPAMISQKTIKNAEGRIQAARHRLAEIEKFNSLATDSTQLYGMVMDLAAEHDVIVQSLQPGNRLSHSSNDVSSSIRLDITVDGTYENVSRFAEAIMSIDAYIQPRTVDVTPTQVDGKRMVSVVLSCDVIRFTPPEDLVDMEEFVHAHP